MCWRILFLWRSHTTLFVFTGITNKYNFEEPDSFDSVLHISTNMVEGGLDTCSGEFEAGVSGIYSISWSFSSEQANCGLKKLERRENYVRETGIGGTYSDQSKSLLMLLLERENIIQLECSSRSKIEKISFCINLVNSHDKNNEKKSSNPNNAPKLKLFPVSEDKVYNISTQGHANYNLAVNVAENFKQNKQISS